jgi:hypothetical protein
MVFRSKVDGWLIWIVRVPMIAAVVFVGIQAIRTQERMIFIVLALVILVYAIVEWIFGSTYYMVDQDFLRIRSGPFRSRVLISDITSISRSNDVIAAPALSLDRLQIRDGSGRTILVSPTEDELFVEALRSVNGKIEVSP